MRYLTDGPIQVLKDFGFVVQLYLVLLSKALVQIDHRVVKLTPMSLKLFSVWKNKFVLEPGKC
jgi:hypothetical protein